MIIKDDEVIFLKENKGVLLPSLKFAHKCLFTVIL